MRRIIYSIFLITAIPVVLLPAADARADTVITRDKRTWSGLIVAENSRQVWVDLGFDVAILPRTKIVSIYRSDPKTVKLLVEKLKASRLERNRLLLLRDKKPQEVPFVPYQGHVVVDVLLEGQVKSKLLLDTGSTFTFLSSDIASRLGISKNNTGRTADVLLSNGKKQRMLITTLKSVRVGGVEARDVEVAILPKMEEDTPFSDGLLGVSFLSRFNFKIDYSRNKLILERNTTKP